MNKLSPLSKTIVETAKGMRKIGLINDQEYKNIHAGSSFDDFLKEDGIFEHCQEVGKSAAVCCTNNPTTVG